ncbi:hypothetical protein GTY83_00420 [Streptomyces sp. SID4928]|uniref:hypothetical protein n=1 Tax=unclassified Streptomyces TaxID=2593676 RepID=UPI0001C18940|nr:hypothetical protein [Streptomyces sp. ACT-1]EGE39501.1 hypothetical protein SACT1_0083 [Streptomyces sp. ACT-1]MYR47596.1 hypothetical protein [Streptomyces sp. SID4928]
MRDMSSPGPAFTEVRLAGPADEVARLMRLLSGVGEVIYGPVTLPRRGGDVSCTAQLVTHPVSGPVPAGQSVSLIVQVGPDTLADLPGEAAAEQVEAVVGVVSALPGVRGKGARLVAAVGRPPARA